VAHEAGDYPLLRAYQGLLDFMDGRGGRFPLEDIQRPVSAAVEDGETETTQAWDLSMLAAGAPGQHGQKTADVSDDLETREVVSPSSHSHLAVRDDLHEVTKPSNVAALRAGADLPSNGGHAAPEPGGSTRKYDINELQRAMIDPPAAPGSATKQCDGAATAAAFRAGKGERTADPQPGPAEHEHTRQYTTDELMKGLGGVGFKTAEQTAVAPEGEAGMSTREYDTSALARGMSAMNTGPQQRIAAPPDPFANIETAHDDPFAGLMDDSQEESVEIEIDSSFDAEDLLDQMLDDPDFSEEPVGGRPRHGLVMAAGTAKIQTLAQWSDEHDGSQDESAVGPLTLPGDKLAQADEADEERTRNVGVYLPHLAKLDLGNKTHELDKIRTQLMPVLVPFDWERQDQVAFQPLLDGVEGSPLVTVAVDYPEKLVYANNSDIKDWGSSFGLLRTMALDNLRTATPDLAGKFNEVDLGHQPIYQLSTGDYFEASRVLLTALGDVGQQLFATEKLWVAVPNRNILLITAATTQRQLEAFAEITLFCFTEKQFPLTSEIFLYGPPGPSVQRIVAV
jgi:uncharacterized protein YtpQ (UPF0354 family)